MSIKKRFSESDLLRIKNAVKEAEQKISGEIVPVIVEKSGEYSVANYKGGLLGAAIAFMSMIVMDRYLIENAGETLYYDPLFIFLVVVLGGLLGATITRFIPEVARKLVTQQSLDAATRQRAENAFLAEEVFNTRQRTGIMIFISFFEREVMVIADKGISKVVEQKEWDRIVQELVRNIRMGKLIDGLEGAIKRCGEILLEKGFTITADDVNELGDDLRID